MKKKSFIIILLLSILFLTKGVNVSADTSLCAYGKEIKNSQYCEINPITIIDSSLPTANRHLKFQKDLSTITETIKYNASIINGEQLLFCLDPNLWPPNYNAYMGSYKYARPLDSTSPAANDLDIALTKLYQLYAKEYFNLRNEKMTGKEKENKYYQVALLSMRAIIFKYKNNYKSVYESVFDKTRTDAYKGLFNQLDGKDVDNPLIAIGNASVNKSHLDKTQKWYCEALLSCESCVNVKSAERKHCESIIKTKKTTIHTFDVKVESIEKDSVTTSGDNTFAKTIPFVVSGLAKFKTALPGYVPSFAITGITCDNKKLSCDLNDPSLKGRNVLSTLPKDEDTYTFYVVVRGNRADILNKKSVNVEVEYKKQHILDPDNLAIIRNQHGSVLYHQRMMVYMPSTPQKATVTINTLLPTSCEYEVVDGVPKYTFDGREVTETEYLNRGCCNVDVDKLEQEESLEIYLNRCSADDVVSLKEQCINDEETEFNKEDNFTESYVFQQSLSNHIMPNIRDAERMYVEDSYSYQDYQDILDNFNNNVEYEYSTTGLSPSNNYCKMYTSEKVKILLPGTVEAASGRYFIFKKGHQPYIEGEVYGNFHTDVDRWLKDLTEIYEREKSAYASWQSAIANKEQKYNEYLAEKAKSEAAKAAKEEYDNKVLERAKAASESADRAVPRAKNNYDAVKKQREALLKYKTECEEKTNLTQDWEYNLDPTVKFYYKQKVNQIDKNHMLTGKAEVIIEEVEMEPSFESDGKYWTEVSTEPELIESSVTGSVSKVSKSFEGYGGLSGGFSVTYDQTPDYQIGYQQTLYYKPSIKYYSLIPSGMYITSQEKRTDTNVLDVGYVFNTEVTNYEGYYETWFEIENVGHIQGTETPNVQKSINKYLEEHKDEFLNHEEKKINDVFANMCFYYNKEILYNRGCHLDCDTPGSDIELRSRVYYRTISIFNVNPNNRENTNWTTEKGLAAQQAIEAAGDNIYDDYTKENLEYSFVLTTKDMADIKKYNKDNSYDDFTLTCVNGKECKSALIETYADSEILSETRSTKWKYFKNGVFESGSIESVLGGAYPPASEELANWP